jgi:hypothetical protein
MIAPFSRHELRKCEGVTMANYPLVIYRFLVTPAIFGVGGCCASGPEPPFENAYSAIGAQVK